MAFGLLSQLGIGIAALLPLTVVFYGWRGLSAASRLAGVVKLVLAAAFGVGVEALRREFGLSWGTVANAAGEAAGFVIDHVNGVLG